MAPERLILLREAHALSQRDLADALAVSPAFISQIESGKRHASPKFLAKLALYFRMEVSVLFQAPRRQETNGHTAPAPPPSPRAAVHALPPRRRRASRAPH